MNAVKTLPNDIILRPRFKFQLNKSKESVLQAFKNASNPHIHISRSDDHLFIKLRKKEQHFWSPQLQLELRDQENVIFLHGVFGPNPTLWTFFMFLHFSVASLFVGFGVWGYANHSLGKSTNLQFIVMGLMIVFWFLFYVFGRLGKRKGKPQMELLFNQMQSILSDA